MLEVCVCAHACIPPDAWKGYMGVPVRGEGGLCCEPDVSGVFVWERERSPVAMAVVKEFIFRRVDAPSL